MSVELDAVTVTVVAEATDGAVNMPVGEIVPALVFHVIPELVELPPTVAINVAVKSCWPPELTVAVPGDKVILGEEL